MKERRLAEDGEAMNAAEVNRSGMAETERELLSDLRRLRRSLRLRPPEECPQVGRSTLGQKVADRVAGVMGSWMFGDTSTGPQLTLEL